MDKRNIPVGTPCHLDWRRMTPADGGRFCGDCKKVVRDLSALSEAEAIQLVRQAHNEDLCVRYVYDRFGRVVFRKDDGLIPASLLLRGRRALLAVAAMATPLALQACNLVGGGEMMGDLAVGPEYQPDPSSDAAPDATDARAPDAEASDAGSDASPDADTDAAPDATPAPL
jgi:hypothetical protein